MNIAQIPDSVELRFCCLSDDMIPHVLKISADAFEKFSSSRDRAKYIKEECDQSRSLNPESLSVPWQCIVGKRFASSIWNDKDHGIFFHMKQANESVLLFKAFVPEVASAH